MTALFVGGYIFVALTIGVVDFKIAAQADRPEGLRGWVAFGITSLLWPLVMGLAVCEFFGEDHSE
jgi:hypothetical protein